jgi:hypothetical protein
LALVSCFDLGNTKDREGDFLLDLNVNYRLGYRDGSWVPIDVVVNNTARDVDGHVELRTYVGDELQSPMYRIPAQSPKSSKKRFRLYCRLDHTTRIEAMLYHKNSPVLPVPATIKINPINSEDLLGLVIDKEPADYGFLNMVFTIGDRSIRYYREEISQETLGLLADFPQCYEPYDAVIVGDIDPGRVAERHRTLLQRYVVEGGILIICTGANAANLRGSWLEDLAGVTIGPTTPVNDAELAAQVFGESDRAGVRPERQGQFAEINPVDPAVRVRGENAVLTAVRPWGSGFIATLAVDASSRLLQDTEGYKRLWRELCGYRRYRGDLNYGAATEYYLNQMPGQAGIQLFSKASVMWYLFLYFVIAIVVNWLVCNALKRRELAWLFLAMFSIGFTAYAMTFGTAGRAKSTQVNQFEVLRVSPRGGSSEIRALASVVTARSSNLSIGLPNEYSLAEGLTSMSPWRLNNPYRGQNAQPFFLVEGVQPRIDRFLVGASELRVLQVHTETQLPGGIDGSLLREGEVFRGTLVNNTGLELTSPYVLIDGRRYPAILTPQGIEVDADVSREAEKQAAQAADRGRGTYPAALGRRRTGPRQQERFAESQGFHAACLNTLFEGDGSKEMRFGRSGPFLVAAVKSAPLGPIRIEGEEKNVVATTYLIADIAVDRVTARPAAYQSLPVRFNGMQWQMYPMPGNSEWTQSAYCLSVEGIPGRSRTEPGVPLTDIRAEIQTPLFGSGAKAGVMHIELYWTSPTPFRAHFLPEGANKTWLASHTVASTDPAAEQVVHQFSGRRGGMDQYVEFRVSERYRLDDWRRHADPSTGILTGTILFDNSPYVVGETYVSLAATLETPLPFQENEDWKPWQ